MTPGPQRFVHELGPMTHADGTRGMTASDQVRHIIFDVLSSLILPFQKHDSCVLGGIID